MKVMENSVECTEDDRLGIIKTLSYIEGFIDSMETVDDTYRNAYINLCNIISEGKDIRWECNKEE